MGGSNSLPDLAAAPGSAARYWEARASRFATEGGGLRAVCSYGMPWFYNRAINLTQRMALEPWLKVAPGTRVLDVGCGIGRWSRRLAAAGAEVTGVDISPTMLAEAQRRAEAEGVAGRCRFVLSDLARLEVAGTFDLILGVTVLQHLLAPADLVAALARLVSRLSPGGRLVLLEAMPSRPTERCETAVFTARTWDDYRVLFEAAGLEVKALSGVDPAPFKILFLPYYRRLPRLVANAALACVTLMGLPLDLALGRRWIARSWHKTVVLSARSGGDDER
jgi:SAM-dependent methyltransferase